MDSSSVKKSVMNQVLAEANLANARVLIEVCRDAGRALARRQWACQCQDRC